MILRKTDSCCIAISPHNVNKGKGAKHLNQNTFVNSNRTMDIATKKLAFVSIIIVSCLTTFGGGTAAIEVNTYTSDEAGNIVVAQKTNYIAGEDIVISITLTGDTKDNENLSRIRILGEFLSITTNKKLGGVIPASGSLEPGKAGPYNWTISSTFISSTLGRDLTGEDYNGDGSPNYIGIIDFIVEVDEKVGNNYNMIAESTATINIVAPEDESGGLAILNNIPIEGLIGFIALLGIVATGTYLMTRETDDIIPDDGPSDRTLESGLGLGLGSSLLGGEDDEEEDDEEDDKPKKRKKSLGSKKKVASKVGKKKAKPPSTKNKGPPKPKDKPKYCPECNDAVQFWSREIYEHDYETEYYCEKCELYVEPILEQNFKKESRTRRSSSRRRGRTGRKSERERKGRTRDRRPESLV